ncbi:MAG: diaminopimelate epimerase [Deltaproteobacteria bacterium]|nr:diaminopimelate epimerase [Deltaproteobacteria bacterium]
MNLWRAHGLGNDYLVWECEAKLSSSLVVALCDRHRGVGGDGVLEPLPGADAAVRIWNPDGSVAEKSGNGLRIFARWWVERRGGPAAFAIRTDAGEVACEVEGDAVRVEMGRAELRFAERRFPDPDLSVTAIGIGNPHAVVFREEPLDALPWRAWGAALEVHPTFPARTNVQFARIAGPGALEVRIWERGAGETLASGSSACAVVAAAVFTRRARAGTFAVHMPGGTLEVSIDEANGMVQRGPVEVVGVVAMDPRWWRTRS